ncbi:hypothetical protein V8E55_009829 [Tylopilus felleus]
MPAQPPSELWYDFLIVVLLDVQVFRSFTLLHLDDLKDFGCRVLRSETSRTASPVTPRPLNTGTSQVGLPAWLSCPLLCVLWPQTPRQRPNLVRNSKSGQSSALNGNSDRPTGVEPMPSGRRRVGQGGVLQGSSAVPLR